MAETIEISKAIIALMLLVGVYGAITLLSRILDVLRQMNSKLEDLEGYISSMSKSMNSMGEQLGSIYGLAKHLHPEADAKARQSKTRIVRAVMQALTEAFKRR
jgi:predicted transposase YbfD/YdcC